jgi:hypothetical protein
MVRKLNFFTLVALVLVLVLPAQAQHSKIPRIGFLAAESESSSKGGEADRPDDPAECVGASG